jgi:pyruvate,orthophosphate dikinase
MGKPCVVGCAAMTIDAATERASLGNSAIVAGDWITIEGDGGKIYLGQRETIVKRPEAELAEIASWRSQQAEDAAEAGHTRPPARKSAPV